MELSKNKKTKRKKTANKLIASNKERKKIPRECLENALKVINDPEDIVWKNRSTACERYIHQNQESASYLTNQSDLFKNELQLRYARESLLRRDWHNLTEILLLFKPQKGNEHIFPIFAKYASICFAYTNQPLLKSLLQSFGCNKNTETVLKKWTQLCKVGDEAGSSEMEEC